MIPPTNECSSNLDKLGCELCEILIQKDQEEDVGPGWNDTDIMWYSQILGLALGWGVRWAAEVYHIIFLQVNQAWVCPVGENMAAFVQTIGWNWTSGGQSETLKSKTSVTTAEKRWEKQRQVYLLRHIRVLHFLLSSVT